MSFYLYFGIGMGVLLVGVVAIGFVYYRLDAVDHWSPTKQAERSAKKALRDAQL